MLNLYLNARPDEQFHVQEGPPLIASHFDWGWLRRTKWVGTASVGPDGIITSPASVFVSWWLFGHLQWYHGLAKVDATRTFMARSGQLGNPPLTQNQYVVTTTPTETKALRWRTKGPGDVTWTNMGGS